MLSLLPLVAEACRHRHYPAHLSLLATDSARLPGVATNVGKKQFKPHLEQFLDMLFYRFDTTISSTMYNNI